MPSKKGPELGQRGGGGPKRLLGNTFCHICRDEKGRQVAPMQDSQPSEGNGGLSRSDHQKTSPSHLRLPCIPRGGVFCSTSIKFTLLTLQLFNVYLTKRENLVKEKTNLERRAYCESSPGEEAKLAGGQEGAGGPAMRSTNHWGTRPGNLTDLLLSPGLLTMSGQSFLLTKGAEDQDAERGWRGR